MTESCRFTFMVVKRFYFVIFKQRQILKRETEIAILKDCIEDLDIEKEIANMTALSSESDDICWFSRRPVDIPSKKHTIVVAIEIGTVASSYVCWIILPAWQGYGMLHTKTLTAVLLDSKKQFVCFGYEAQDEYNRLKHDNEDREWYYFTKFKLRLSTSEDGELQMTTEDGNKKLPADLVYSTTIEYLVSKFTNQLLKQQSALTKDDVCWVFTFPVAPNALWKKLLNTSAMKAGISMDNLLLMSEPEANLLFCTQKPNLSESALEYGFQNDIKGERFLIVNLGSGSCDMTVYHRKGDSTIQGVFNASFHSVGFAEITKAINKLLEELFGLEIMSKFRDDNEDEANEFLNTFFTKLKQYDPTKNKFMVVKLPVEIFKLFEQETGGTFKDTLHSNRHGQDIQLCADKIKISSSIIEQFFVEAMTIVFKTIKYVLKQQNVTDIIFTGGFVEILLVQRQLRDRFCKKNVIIPPDPGHSVVNGAVLIVQVINGTTK